MHVVCNVLENVSLVRAIISGQVCFHHKLKIRCVGSLGTESVHVRYPGGGIEVGVIFDRTEIEGPAFGANDDIREE